MRAFLGLGLACLVSAAAVSHPEEPETPIGRFDDGELVSPSGRWVHWSDRFCCNGSSTSIIDIVSGGAVETSGALSVTGETVANRVWVGAGALFWFPEPRDLSGHSEIAFWARGEGGPWRLFMFGRNPAQDIASVEFSARKAWEEVHIPLTAFDGVPPDMVSGFLFGRGTPPGAFSFQIDEVRLR